MEQKMSNEDAKLKHSKRIQKTQNQIKKQTKIANSHGMPVDEPHKFAKHHAMDCGNPRKIWKEKTIQEKRFEVKDD